MNSPSRRLPTGMYYRLIWHFRFSPLGPSASQVPRRPADMSLTSTIGVRQAAPRFCGAQPPPSRRGESGRSCLFRQLVRVDSRQLLFLPPVLRGLMATSACNPAEPSPVDPTRPHRHYFTTLRLSLPLYMAHKPFFTSRVQHRIKELKQWIRERSQAQPSSSRGYSSGKPKLA